MACAFGLRGDRALFEGSLGDFGGQGQQMSPSNVVLQPFYLDNVVVMFECEVRK